MITFHLPIIPPKTTSQGAGKRIVIIKSKATGKHRPLFFKNQKAKAAEQDFLILCKPFAPPTPIEGPVCLKVDFVWPWRASEPQWRKELGRVHHTSKPDCSNIIKILEDCLTKLRFWNDDGQVSIEHISKAWGDEVGIYVSIIPLEDPPRAAKAGKLKSRNQQAFL
jgi:Holliday junction resolvase RusA-like endonuclease